MAGAFDRVLVARPRPGASADVGKARSMSMKSRKYNNAPSNTPSALTLARPSGRDGQGLLNAKWCNAECGIAATELLKEL